MYKLILSFLLSFNFLTAQNTQSFFLDSANEIPLLTFDKPADIEELLNDEAPKIRESAKHSLMKRSL